MTWWRRVLAGAPAVAVGVQGWGQLPWWGTVLAVALTGAPVLVQGDGGGRGGATGG